MGQRSGHCWGWGKLCALVIALCLLGWHGEARAQATEPANQPAAVQDLVRLLADPAVRGWLEQQGKAAPPAPERPASEVVETSPQQLVSTALTALRAHLLFMARSFPEIGPALAEARTVLQSELEERGLLRVLLLVVVFVASGFALEKVYWWLTAGYRKSQIADAGVASPRARLLGLARRLMVSIGWVGSFALGSIGSFLAFDWPPVMRAIVLSYLLAFLAARLTLVVGRVILHPFEEKFRTIPIAPEVGRFWWMWSGVFVGWWAFTLATRGLLVSLGFPPGPLAALMPIFGLVTIAIVLWGVWWRPLLPGLDGEPAPARRGWLWTGIFALVWLVRVAGLLSLSWLALVVLSLRVLLAMTKRTVAWVLRSDAADEPGQAVSPFSVLCFERGLRMVWIILGAYVVANAFDVDLGAMATDDSLGTRFVRGAVNALVITLIAEFLWHAVRAWLDDRISAAQAEGTGADAHRRARLRTLLPIVRNVVLVVLVVMAGLMALSSLGVEIGPLIAGAGVVGVAIGFGAQTLVKDIISGMFYLMDDAFRVGEYITSGSYKGTVESFSLRSVKLRHHRGPLFTVPFGELGAVQNMSRDWVIDKMSIGLEYDTDLDKVKKIIKQIGKELMADPEFQPNIIETLKMQGVESFGEYAIQIRLKLMTKPGEQFVIRRRAYAMMQKAFAANGIKFAFPTVHVAGGGEVDADAAMAKQMMDMVQAKAAAGPA